MPVNMPTHAHGQGYSDLNWLIPELVNRIDFKKGPYYADEGDFSSAGAARIGLFDRPAARHRLRHLRRARVRTRAAREIDADGVGRSALRARGRAQRRPWDNPEKFHRLNGVLRYSFGDVGNRSSITAMGYSAGWNSTDQVPLRAVQEGLIDRFGAIDPTDGGRTARYSLSYDTERSFDNGVFRLNAFAIQSRLDLFSDFTYNLENATPLNADQFEQPSTGASSASTRAAAST